LKVLRLATGYQCQLRCRACYAPHNDFTTPLDFVHRVMENASDEGYKHMALGGGEPLFTLDHTLHVLEMGVAAGLTSAVTTSGSSLDATTLARLDASGLDHLQLSLGDGRVNLANAYEFMLRVRRKCTFGVNLLLSSRLVGLLPAFVRRFDADMVDQVTLLLPKGGFVPRFSREEFLRYFAVLRSLKPRHTVIRIDCATRQVLNGMCESEGCSVFPDGSVSRCAFGCGRRMPWSGSLNKALTGDVNSCREGQLVVA
jgi:hypothetical protein